MLLWFLPVFAFEEVCAELPPGPPKGAKAIAASALPWVHEVRRAAVDGQSVDPGPGVHAWLLNDLEAPTKEPIAGEVEAVRDAEGNGWLLVELRAKRRAALQPANITAIVDVGRTMESIVTREISVLNNVGWATILPPATRIDLTRSLLRDLIEALPEGSKLSILAVDGRNARVVLQPTTDRVQMTSHVQRLNAKIVSSFDPEVASTLTELRRGTFEACGDNRSLLFAGSLSDLVKKQLESSVGNWASEGMEQWSFAVGSYVPLDVEALKTTDRTGAWVLNNVSDGPILWPAFFDAGGLVVRDIQIDIPGAPNPEPMHLESGQTWSRLVALQPSQLEGLTVEVSAGGEILQLPVTSIGELSGASAGMRTRVALAGGDRSLLPRRGQGAEVGTWLRGLSASRPEPDTIVQDASVEPFEDGVDLVVSLEGGEGLDPTKILLLGSGEPPVAYARYLGELRLLWHLDTPPSSIQIHGGGLPTTEVLVPHPHLRRALEVRFLDARRRGSPWVPDGEPRARLAMHLARAAHEDGDDDRVLDLTKTCFADIDPRIALVCGWVRGTVLHDRGKVQEAIEVLKPSTERSRVDAPLAILMGRLTARMEDWDASEWWYLMSLRDGDDAGEAARELGPILLDRGMHAMAAALFARRVLLHPSDHEIRRELEALLDMKSWNKKGPSRGRLSTVQPNGGKKRIKKLEALLYDWTQAQHYELRIEGTPQHRDPWYQWMTDPFAQVVRYQLSETGAVWILFDRKEVPERYHRTFDMVQELLGVEE